MRTGVLSVTIAIGLVIPAAFAGVEPCTGEQALRAEREVALVHERAWTWSMLFDSFQRYGHCDDSKNPGTWDAELATAYDGAVQHLLIDDWGHFSIFAALSRKDLRFRAFVLSHINEDFPLEGAQKVVQSAEQRCPAHEKALCTEIAKAARPTS